MIRNFFAFTFVLCVIFAALETVNAQNNPIPTAFLKTTAPPIDLDDLFKVPEKATPEELLGFLETALMTAQQRLADQFANQNVNEEEILKYLQEKCLVLFNEVADRILAAKPDDELKRPALMLKIQSWFLQKQLNPDKQYDFNEFLAYLEKEGISQEMLTNAKTSYYIFALIELTRANQPPVDNFLKLKEEIKTFVEENAEHGAIQIIPVVFEIAGMLATHIDNEQLALDTLQEFADLLEKIKDKVGDVTAQEFANDIKATLFRRNLAGKEFTLEGILLDGNKFDWTKYKDKVVIIDFWATWCRPCIEASNILKELYAQYKTKGLEIIGIDVWEREGTTTEEIKKFLEAAKIPWTQIDDRQTVKAGMDSLAEKFHVQGIPTLILVGRDGKVISADLECFNGSLQEALAELFQEKPEQEK